MFQIHLLNAQLGQQIGHFLVGAFPLFVLLPAQQQRFHARLIQFGAFVGQCAPIRLHQSHNRQEHGVGGERAQTAVGRLLQLANIPLRLLRAEFAHAVQGGVPALNKAVNLLFAKRLQSSDVCARRGFFGHKRQGAAGGYPAASPQSTLLQGGDGLPHRSALVGRHFVYSIEQPDKMPFFAEPLQSGHGRA